jgi:hypothetical protein
MYLGARHASPIRRPFDVQPLRAGLRTEWEAIRCREIGPRPQRPVASAALGDTPARGMFAPIRSVL